MFSFSINCYEKSSYHDLEYCIQCGTASYLRFTYLTVYIFHFGANLGQCTTSVFGNTGACYWHETTPRTWMDALAVCMEKGGTLATIENVQTFNFIDNAGFFGGE